MILGMLLKLCAGRRRRRRSSLKEKEQMRMCGEFWVWAVGDDSFLWDFSALYWSLTGYWPPASIGAPFTWR